MFPTDPVVNDYRYCNWFLLCTRMYMYTQLWEIIATHWPLFTPDRAFLPYFWKQGHSLFDPDLMSNGWNRTSPETLFQRLQCQGKKSTWKKHWNVVWDVWEEWSWFMALTRSIIVVFKQSCQSSLKSNYFCWALEIRGRLSNRAIFVYFPTEKNTTQLFSPTYVSVNRVIIYP